MKPEVHLFVIWEKARVIQEKILEDITKHFTILKQYEITWTRRLVPSNYQRFCGTRLGDELDIKIEKCGKGEFLLVIVRDENPVYEARDTFHGRESVNKNMFDAKYRYRDWTGLYIGVHATDNTRETNHDLTMLIGKNVEDFLATCKDSMVEKLYRDLEGAEGWNSIEQLFYVLNNTVRYAVMRGYGELASGDYIDHGDTDIMTDDYDNLWIIVNSPKKYAETKKPKADVRIGANSYLLDIWNCGQNGYDYFDPVWAKKMLDSAIEWHGMKILNPENDFYCLLYHCLTNKGFIADDYLPKLKRYKEEFGLKENDWHKILVTYLTKHQYEIIYPKDPGTCFDLSNKVIADYALRNGGVCIFTNDEMKIYGEGDALKVKCSADIAGLNKSDVIKVYDYLKSLEPQRKNPIKALYRKFVPKRLRKVLSKVKKFIK